MTKTSTKGFSLYLSSFLAAMTCPCHVPLYIFLFSGTSIGVFFSENQWLLFVSLGILFPVFIFLAIISYRRIKRQNSGCSKV